MIRRRFSVLFVAATMSALAPLAGSGQAQTGGDDTWTLPRTVDGQPDLQGRWTMATFTPLQRPERFADREFLTEEEAAELRDLVTTDGTNPLARNLFGETSDDQRRENTVQTKENIHYDNAIWLTEENPKNISSLRTSLVVDPPDGHIPLMIVEAQARQAERAKTNRFLMANLREPSFDGYHTRTLAERCIVWRHEGPPMVPAAYNDILQIFQTRDYVVIFQEMSNNNPRIVPMDGRPHLPDRIRLWPGDSRGRWEGETLVIETTNFTHKTHYQGSSESLKVVERFRRTGPDIIHYEWTLEDPKTWERPWTAEVPLIASDEMMFEYACHEGNRDLGNILTIARNLETQAGETAATTGGAR